MKRHPYLQQLSDEELFKLDSHLAFEYQARIIELLDRNEITQFTFDGPMANCPMATVWDFKEDRNIHVVSVGYTIDMVGTKHLPGKYLFLVDDKDVLYSGDDCILNPSLWDIYREMKDYLK